MTPTEFPDQPLKGLRILSLALNLPGPAALMRCRALGATCSKVESPAGDPMRHYRPAFYAHLTEGVRVLTLDLKTDAGRAALGEELSATDVLLTSFRPSALRKLGLDWSALQARWPALSQVAIVGASGARAEEPGHDLTYLAQHGLITGTELPATLYADMSGALLAVEAVLRCARGRPEADVPSRIGRFIEVALADAAGWLALPRQFGLTAPAGMVGGAHAGYRVYPCRDGRVAVAALEPHFTRALCDAAGVAHDAADPTAPATHEAIAAFLLGRTREQLDQLARDRDIPLHTLEAAD
ncbi:MAG: CoA transferase [Burkholderiales bacterium]